MAVWWWKFWLSTSVPLILQPTSFLFGLLWCHQEEGKVGISPYRPGEGRSLVSRLCWCEYGWGAGVQLFSVVFGRHRAVTVKNFLICKISPFPVLWQRKFGFLGGLLCLCQLAFLGLWLLQQPEIWEAKRKLRECPCHSLGAEIPGWFAFSPLLVFLGLFYI